MRTFFLYLFLLATFGCFAQSDNAGPGRAVRFDGVDDYVDLGNILDDLPAAFTVSAWIYIDPTTTGPLPILVSQDNDDLYNGFWFFVNPTAVWIEMGDGKGYNQPAFRQGKQAQIPDIRGKWVHVSAVVRSTFDIDLYVNGTNVGGYTTGGSNLPMASNYPNDITKAGYFFSNNIIYRFKGIMDEVRVWKKPLSETEVRARMCKRVLPTDPELIGYWGFDETSGVAVKDYSSKGYNGKLVNNPSRVYSGAPLGDESVFLYKESFANEKLALDKVNVNHVSSDAMGVQIYKVTKDPSRTDGLDPTKPLNPYYGVFLTDINNTDSQFDLDLPGSCGYSRTDNTIASWTKLTSTTGIPKRTELSTSLGSLKLDLGPDTVLCTSVKYLLDSELPSSGNTFKWSSGQTSPSIEATAAGLYILKVSNGCGEASDSVKISLMNDVPKVNLGADLTLCSHGETIKIKTNLPPEYDATSVWSTKFKGGSIEVDKSGSYWVEVSNFCGSVTDTVIVRNSEHIGMIPNVFTPNNDQVNQTFELPLPATTNNQLILYNRWGEMIYSTFNYRNDWDGAGFPSGVYFYQLRTDCDGEKRGSITIAK